MMGARRTAGADVPVSRPGAIIGTEMNVTTTGWLGAFSGGDLSPLQKATALDSMSDARELAAEKREADEREAARQDRLDAMLFSNAQNGDPLGQIQLARAAFTVADDQVRDLSAQLARAEAKRDRAQSNITFFASRAQQANQLAQRSSNDLLAPAKEALAEAASQRVERMLAAVSRPKGAPVSPGYAVRAETQLDCTHCAEAGASAEESYLLHADPDAPWAVAGPDGAPQRSAHGRQPMIQR